MREFEHKRKVRKIASSPFVLVPLAIILFFLVRGVWNTYRRDRESVELLQVSEERLIRLKGRETQLSAATVKLSTESGIEEEIRDRLQMAKDGEREIVIVDNGDTSRSVASSSPTFLQKIWNFFTIR